MRWLHIVAFLTALASCSSGIELSPDSAEPVASVAPAPTAAPVTTSNTTTTATPITDSTIAVTTTSPPTTPLPTTQPAPADPPESTGAFVYAPAGAFEIAGSPMIEFSIATEDGTSVDVDGLATFVIATLGDERGWVGRGAGFRLVEEGGLFTLAVATPDTVDRLCRPLQTNGRFSCARNGWIALNLTRWQEATNDWPADLDTYRRYLVNHEVGHYIVGAAHAVCTAPGETAPIMMQQTKGLGGCLTNGWVDP